MGSFIILVGMPRSLLRGFQVLVNSVPEGAKFRNTPSACGGGRNFEEFVSLFEKNGKFKKLLEVDKTRMVVIVTSNETLQDAMVRHIACQQIRNLIFDPAFGQVNFEELIWLPDIGYGAWFKLGGSPKETHCFADWHDEFGRCWDGSVYRREVDLDSPINCWKE